MGALRTAKKLLCPQLFEAKKYVIKKLETEYDNSKESFASMCRRHTGHSTKDEIKKAMDVTLTARRNNNV